MQPLSNPELEYLRAVNSAAPPKDPQLLFLLMGAFANANRAGEGAAFLSARLNEFQPRLTDPQKALYLSAIALLRAQHAPSVSVFTRIAVVKGAIAMLDQAKALSGGEIFVVNWISGVVRSQLPGFFGQRKAARLDLAWCETNAIKAPHSGWLREVYFGLGKLALGDAKRASAQEYLRRSGYESFSKSVMLITPFSNDPAAGHAFADRRIREVVPGRVYALSGFEFTEFYFVVSDDGAQLIGIDAGTRADSAKAAYEALRSYAPTLPALTTIFVTHAHWDHVGGQRYFRGLEPPPRFFARSNYHEEIARELGAPNSFGKYFFGDRFRLDDVTAFKPDATIDRATELTIGGTRIELIPIDGGETHDAMFVHLPELAVLFAGDFIMPYIGAPFAAEGNLQGLFDAIDIVVQKRPRHLLHGHEPLTQNFSSPEMLAQVKTDLAWLSDQVRAAIARGESRAAIHEANLIPPGLLGGRPDVPLAYLTMREHVIDRLFHQNTGYWQANLDGLDHLSDADRGDLLVDYLDLSEKRLLGAIERMAADGRYELAAALLRWSIARLERSDALARARRSVYLKLMEKYQNTDPFKYILYSAAIGERTPAMASESRSPAWSVAGISQRQQEPAQQVAQL
ncbi:MAG TPA: MBL fold metallo-hydrolase [Candidatus Cybelea sp.]|jgi:glyoxylase-like metal-dependent hydrolase (beta-lactamase superfamily II)